MQANLNLPARSIPIVLRIVPKIVNAAGKGMTASTARTPYKGGQLRQNRRVIPRPNGATMMWSARYAAVQNLGFRRGARPFTNYTTAGTGPKFVEDAIKAVRAEIRGIK